jgi:hypothetical protein
MTLEETGASSMTLKLLIPACGLSMRKNIKWKKIKDNYTTKIMGGWGINKNWTAV